MPEQFIVRKGWRRKGRIWFGKVEAAVSPGIPTGNGTMNFSTPAASPNNSTALLALLEDI